MKTRFGIAMLAVLSILAAAVAFTVMTSDTALALKLQPLEDRVVLRLTSEQSPSAAAAPTPVLGDVIAVGPGEFSPFTGERIPLDVVVGDRVYFLVGDARRIELDGLIYYVIEAPDILAILA